MADGNIDNRFAINGATNDKNITSGGFLAINENYLYCAGNGKLDNAFLLKIRTESSIPPDNEFGNYQNGKSIINNNLQYKRSICNLTIDKSGFVLVSGSRPYALYKISPTTGNRVLGLHNGSGVIENKNSICYSKVLVDSNNNYILMGITVNNDNNIKYGLELVKYNSNGTLVNSFGNNGEVFYNEVNFYPNSFALDQDNNIYVVGSVVDNNFHKMVYVIKFNHNGELDRTFGTDGKYIIDFSNREMEAVDIAIDKDNKIIVAFNDDRHINFGFTRLYLNGTPDNNFVEYWVTDGLNNILFYQESNYKLYKITIDGLNRIIAIGEKGNEGFIMRFNIQLP
jgi:uncharacterized delta-60 repeat protein